MINIFTLNVNFIDVNDEKIYEMLSKKRIEKIKNTSNIQNKRQSIGAELMLNCAVKMLYKDAHIPILWDTDNNGKPYLKNYADIHFNISHSKDYAVCAVSDKEIGIDIQYMRKVNYALADKCFCDEEKRFFENAENKNEAFYKIWTRKESFLKACGMGITIPLNAFSVLDEIKYNGKYYKFRDGIMPDENYSISVCTENE